MTSSRYSILLAHVCAIFLCSWDVDDSLVGQLTSILPQKGGTGALGASIASMAKLTNPVLCVDPSREMLEVVDKTKD